MRVPLSWLREFAAIDASASVSQLSEAFSNLGLVVDGVEVAGSDLAGVVVARVLGLRSHPAADRVQLVDVDAGDGSALQIVCGAFNMAVGDLVPLATIGTAMPNGMVIGRRQVRGEWSNGMLCSSDELQLPDPTLGSGDGGRASGILILPAGESVRPGVALRDAIGVSAEVVFDLDISPNRPDALSIVGVARDLAAALGVSFRGPGAGVAGGAPGVAGGREAPVTVSSPDLCPRFTATVVEGIRIGPSPAWLAQRLTLAGMRTISNVVDVSNYVMLELGQPNHAYDLDRLPGGGLGVRRARSGESLVTLDGVERRLDTEDCLIVDGQDNGVGIGGIMGGASSEISDATSTVLLEAAHFNPMAIARTGKRLGLHTEARSRFERGVDPGVIDAAVDRFVALLASASPGATLRRGPTVDVVSEEHLPKPLPVVVRTARVNHLLGTALGDEDIARLLEPIGFTVTPSDGVVGDGVPGGDGVAGDAVANDAVATEAVVGGDGVVGGVQVVTIPTWRPDSTREIDVIEEVARLYGYRNIARTLPPGVRTGGGLSDYQRHRRRVREILAGAGISEAWTTTFLGPGDLERAGLVADAVEVENPLDRSESLLRTSLVPGLLKAIRFNADRQAPDVALFESGHVFRRPAPDSATQVPDEREELAVVLAGAGADAGAAARVWGVLASALRLADVRLAPPRDGDHGAGRGMHPTRRAELIVASTGAVLGALGEVDPAVVAAYGLVGRVGLVQVRLENLFSAPRRDSQAQPVSRYPASDVDLAFVVNNSVSAAEVAATVKAGAGELVESVNLFDVYRGTGVGPAQRSLAYHVRLRAHDHTLTDQEVASIRQRAIDAVVSAHGAELRG